MEIPIVLQIAAPEAILAIGALALLVFGAFRGDLLVYQQTQSGKWSV